MAGILNNGGPRSSFLSQNSRSISWIGSEMEGVTDEELVKLVTDIKEQLKILVLENEILEKTIMRHEPALMNGVYQALEYATRRNSNSSLGSVIKLQASKYGLTENLFSTPKLIASPSRIMASPSRISTKRVDSVVVLGSTIVSGSGPRINVLERSELVSAETNTLCSSLNKERNKAAKQHALLKAKLEEIGIRVADIEKAKKLFDQVVLVEGWDKIAQRIPAEIWIRFMTEWVKITDSQIGKLRLRTSTFNTHYSKLKSQIKAKAELSENLRPVDFEKMKIKNCECMKLIEHQLQQLEELKKLTGDANLNLAIHKKAMMDQNSYLNKVMKTTEVKARLTVQLDEERNRIQIQANSLSQRLNEVRKLRLKYQVPNIMEYVNVKWVVTDLKHAIKMLENRKHIQLIALTSCNRKLQDMNKIHNKISEQNAVEERTTIKLKRPNQD